MSEYKMGGNCPRCKRDYEEYPALSRVDNKTYICSKCGTEEGLFNFMNPGKPLTPVDGPVI
jgi:ribosomal protein L37AE/L43A